MYFRLGTLTGRRGSGPAGPPGGQTDRQRWRAGLGGRLPGRQWTACPLPVLFCHFACVSRWKPHQTLNIQRADCGRGKAACGRHGVRWGACRGWGAGPQQGDRAVWFWAVTCCHPRKGRLLAENAQRQSSLWPKGRASAREGGRGRVRPRGRGAWRDRHSVFALRLWQGQRQESGGSASCGVPAPSSEIPRLSIWRTPQMPVVLKKPMGEFPLWLSGLRT